MIIFIAMGLHIVVYAAAGIILKKNTDVLPRAQALSMQFFFAAVLVWMIAIATGERISAQLIIVIGLVGSVNALGSYAQWQAYSFSLSKTNVFLPLHGVIAAVLSAALLKEITLFQNLWFAGGVMLMFASSFILQKKDARDAERTNSSWFFATGCAILVFGFVLFLMKFFADSKISQLAFLTAWYSGAFLGSLPLVMLERGKNKKTLFQPLLWLVPIASIGIVAAQATQYWALQLAPANFVLPIVIFGRTALTIFAGWWIFNESQGLSGAQKIGFLMGFVGLALILASNPKP